MTLRLPNEPRYGIHFAEGLARCLNDQAFYFTQLQAFRAGFAPYAGQIEEQIRLARWAEAEALVHTLKGTSGMLGMNDLHASSEALDRLLKSAMGGVVVPLEAPLRQVLADLECVCEGIRSLAGGVPS